MPKDHSNRASSPPPPPYTPFSERTPLIRRQDVDDVEAPHSQPLFTRRAKAALILNLISLLSLTLGLSLLLVAGWDLLFPSPPKIPAPTVVDVSVAVIGAGPAGINTAYTLAKRFEGRNDVRVNITVFEQAPRIGGRMVLSPDKGFGISVHAEDVAGGCLGHNHILRERASSALGVKFGMSGGKVVTGRKDGVGFWDGDEMEMEMRRPRGDIGWAMWVKLVWHYGASFWRAGNLPTGTMKGWRSLLNNGGEVEGLGSWVSGGSVSGAVSLSGKERLEKNGVEGDYVRDVMRAQVRRQSGCEVEELSDLALSMALEREDKGFCVDGEGGRLVDVLEKFLSESKAEVRLGTKITGLKREFIQEGRDAWILELRGPGQKQMGYEVFDKVIVAAPWNTSSLLSADESEKQEQIIYHSLWITLISSTSKLDSSNFSESNSSPSQILPIQSPTLPQYLREIHEISHLRDIYHPSPPSSIHNSSLYRILSSEPIPLDTLATFWDKGMEELYMQKLENAYPMLYPRSDGFGKFRVNEGLWWTGGVEAVASQVDAAWVVGENVGALVGNDVEDSLKRVLDLDA
jgi:prenylcysteine oxidase / farnesylcysteine lyase